MEYKNARYNHRDTIDCEINHPIYGWIETTLDPDDAATAALYEEVNKGEVGPYVPVELPEVYNPIARWRFAAMIDYLDIRGSINNEIDKVPDLLKRATMKAKFNDVGEVHFDESFIQELAPLILGPEWETQIKLLWRQAESL